jgi:diguanylate cyclase
LRTTDTGGVTGGDVAVLQKQEAMASVAESPGTERAAEFLRLALPLMTRHGVPVTPQNYAIWYSYVNGDNPELNAEVDRLIGEQRQFTEVINTQLYRQYVAEHDIENVDQVRAGLHTILSDLCSSLNQAGNDADAYEGTLGGFVTSVATKNDLDDIRQLLKSLVCETHTMKQATHKMQSHFETKSKEIEELQEQLEMERKRAITDPLTGLFNRFALMDHLNAAIVEMPQDKPPSLLMIDVDHFKSINDNHGHLIGDRVIRFVAQTVQKNIKGRDIAARYGGEEFTVLLPSTGTTGAGAVADAIRVAVAGAQLVRADNKKPLGQITVSAGVATYQPGEDMMDLINRADQALYQAKNAGRNRVCLAD